MNTTKDMSSDIRETIAETREKMDDTIEELGQRLNPKQIAQEVGTWWEELVDADTLDRVKDRGADVVEHVERHPVPYALVGLGIGLGVYAAFKDHSRTRRQVRRLRHRAGDAMESARDASEHAMDSAKEASGHAAETVKHAYESTADSVKDGYDRASAAAEDFAGHARSAARGAGDAFQRATDEQPLVVGAGLAAAGLLVGLLLPRSKPEDRLMGQESEDFRHRARQAGKDVVERGKEAGKDVLERGREALHDTIEDAQDRAEEKGLKPKQLKEEAKSQAKAGAEEAKKEVSKKSSSGSGKS